MINSEKKYSYYIEISKACVNCVQKNELMLV